MRPVTREILLFLALTCAFSALPLSLMVQAGSLGIGGGMAVVALMWCPALAALVTCAILKIDIGSLGWRWRPWKYEWAGYLLPLLYALPVYVIVWFAIDGAFAYDAFAARAAKAWGMPESPGAATWLLALPSTAILGVVTGLATALGEEIGWRGFLLPRLAARMGFTIGCLTSGIVWAVWHYPGLLWAGYDAGTSKPYELACFTAMIVSLSFILGWLRLKSGSLWPCAVLHASHNLFIQAIFDGMTASKGDAAWLTTEFGLGLAVTTMIVAVYLWTRRGEVASFRLPER
jgi:membrane protease YdiL (CAAX protease family)